MDPKEIKRVSLKYCVSILTNKEPKEEYRDQFKLKEELHKVRMLEVVEDDINELSEEMFYNAIEKVSQKARDKYKFILNGGQSFVNALFNIFFWIWKTEEIPLEWHNSKLVQI